MILRGKMNIIRKSQIHFFLDTIINHNQEKKSFFVQELLQKMTHSSQSFIENEIV